jgi:polyhydroxybutyrate depolymerase
MSGTIRAAAVALAGLLTAAGCSRSDMTLPGPASTSTSSPPVEVSDAPSENVDGTTIGSSTTVASSTASLPTGSAVGSDGTTSVPPTCSAESTTIDIDGRAVLLRVPPASAPGPVVIALHGYGGTPDSIETVSGLTDVASRTGSIIAYPSGSPRDNRLGWTSGATRYATTNVDDVAVVGDVLDALETRPCADPARVFLVGESNGGGMAVRAACDARLSGRVAGIVLVNPAIDPGVLATCPGPAGPVAVLAEAGLHDDVVGFDGKAKPFVAAEYWFAALAGRLGGCATPATESTFSPTVQALSGSDCQRCAVLYEVADGIHVWPGTTAPLNGLTPGTFALSEMIEQILTGSASPCGSST